MSVLDNLTAFLDRSIYSPLLVADPCYIRIKNDYGDILQFIADTKDINVATATGEEQEYLVLLAKKEVYLRLAVSVAPEFNVEAEFTKLLKSDRFNHYMGLIAQVDRDTATSDVAMHIVKLGQALIDVRNGTKRNYELSTAQSISAEFVVAADHLDVSFNAFDTSKGVFGAYEILIGTESFYDEFEDSPVDYSKVFYSITLTDIFKTKNRIKNLTSATPYYVLIVFKGRNGRKDYNYSTKTTL